MSRTLHRACPAGGGPHTRAIIADSGRHPVAAAGRGVASHTRPTPAPLPHSAERWRAPSWTLLQPDWPLVPPFVPGRVGARSKPAAAPAPIPTLCSTSPQFAYGPSWLAGHALDGRLACQHYGA